MADFKGKDGSVTFLEACSSSRGDSSPILKSANLSEDERKYFESIFKKYDRDGNGTIDVKELSAMLREDQEVSDRIVKKLIKYSDRNNDGKIDVHEFTDMMFDKKFKDLFGHYVKNYVNWVLPPDKRHKFKRVDSRFSSESGGYVETDGAYEDGWSCWPPPACMVLVSVLEIICFILNQYLQRDSKWIDDANGPVAKYLIYDPEKRQECWRFLTYMFVHIGWVHLATNLVTQIFLGVALELRNRWYRIITVYTLGVIAGSLVTSIMDPKVYLAGASGGVYAIITAHLSNIIINWKEMVCPGVQLVVFLLLISADVSTAVYNRHYSTDQTPIGYAAHAGGALAGFLVGIWVLKNVASTRKEDYLWWAALVLYILLMGTAIVLNVFWKDHFLPTS